MNVIFFLSLKKIRNAYFKKESTVLNKLLQLQVRNIVPIFFMFCEILFILLVGY